MESLVLKPSRPKQSLHYEAELAGCSVLVVEGDNTCRSVMATQLRELGFSTVTQQSRIRQARELLNTRRFDVILCSHYFDGNSPTGQDLLDDLRREAMLPLSTVFIMVTSEASYAKVEQAAESGLDGYLLKPHSAANLMRLLLAARRRKQHMADIFWALEQQQLAQAIRLCQQRFDSRSMFWLYSARLGAELMLRTAQYEQAGALYRSVVAATGEPWARAGIARVMLSLGQFGQATAALETLTREVPDFADGYDVLGRAQLKLGLLEQAMASYRVASDLTPSSIARLQRLGMLAYYVGDPAEAEQLLHQATHLGQNSRSYDYQTLALLSLLRATQGNWPGVQRVRDVAKAMQRKAPDIMRLRRVGMLVDGAALLQHQSSPEALSIVRELGGALQAPEFDFDLACNLLNLLSLLASDGSHVEEANETVMRLANRFCTSDATCALLTSAAKAHEGFTQVVRQCNEHLMSLSEQAMKLHLDGDYRGAIDRFQALADTHLNARMFETANRLFLRHASEFADAAQRQAALESLRERAGVSRARPGYGDSQGRPPAGVVLRISTSLPDAMNSWYWTVHTP
ncbi:MAG: response regulator [Betaproteobacteria bacterium]